MSTPKTSAVPQQSLPNRLSTSTQSSSRHLRRRGRHYSRLVISICAIQAALSLTLVWSNTAYIDEANYLWIGHLEIAHWLHGTSWPSAYANQIFSGSPLIYPPLGALADGVSRLVGARILSLCFMLGATALLYLTASRLVGRRAATVAAALWALSEPVIRLAFATYDPLSIFFTALSAWLIVQVCYHRHRSRVVFLTAAAISLALANATAYSGIVIDPVVIAFAFFVWLPRSSVRRVLFQVMWLIVVLVMVFSLLITASGSWAGLLFTVVARNIADYQSIPVILSEILGYSGLVVVLAIVGSIAAVNTENRTQAALLVLVGCAVLIVPAAQLRDQTAWSIDKHLAYGIWFAAIAGGYACSQLIRWLPGSKRRVAALCCVLALAYVGAISWESAWERYHAWPNASAFVAAFKPVAAQVRGSIYVPGHETNIAEYYTPQGIDWTRWSAALSLDPVAVPSNSWPSYYSAQLHTGDYGVIVLFYATTFSSAPDLPDKVLFPLSGNDTSQQLLGLVADNSGEPGLSALTLALERSKYYKLVGKGPYNAAHDNGIYVIWEKRVQR
jgi:4-amino-4-deoxy-L-arabinose transferase-like glycosyltransferase